MAFPAESLEKCYRISNIPHDWTDVTVFHNLGERFGIQKALKHELMLFPALDGQGKVGLLILTGMPAFFGKIQPETKGTEVVGPGITIDTHFYGLTPLHWPLQGNVDVEYVFIFYFFLSITITVAAAVAGVALELVAVVRGQANTHTHSSSIVAVTGLGGHAFGSWRCHESRKLWLKDFLPKEVDGSMRVMTFGYDSSLTGSRTSKIDVGVYAKDLVEELCKARASVCFASFFDMLCGCVALCLGC